MNKKRVIIELIILTILIVISFFTRDIQSVFLGISQLEFLFGIASVYIFFRGLISLIVSAIKYKTTGSFKNYLGNEAKIYFENSVYLHLSVIFFIMIFATSTLMITFILLFLIFVILWILSKLSIMLMENKSGRKKKYKKINDVDYFNRYGDTEEDFCNFISLDYYSDLGFEFFKILTDNTFGILNNYNEETSIILLDKLSKTNYLFLMPRCMFFGDVNILCGVINSYLEKIDVKCVINPLDILKKDSEQISNRRRDYIDTLWNDLSIIDEILKKKKHRIISVGVSDSSDTYLCLSVVSKDIYKKVINFRNDNFTE